MSSLENGGPALAVLLSLLAGLGTGVGSCISFFGLRLSKRFLAFALGFSAGVMIYISFGEILFRSHEVLVAQMGSLSGGLVTTAAFVVGMIIVAIIDRWMPWHEEIYENGRKGGPGEERLMRVGVLTAVGIAIHNFPEGVATMMASMNDIHVGISVAAAIALHNIPEGVAVSLPILWATGSKKKAFWISFCSGLTEPIGAVVGLIILHRFFSQTLFGVCLAGVAGIMVYIALDELLPTAREYGEKHLAIYGVILGMAMTAIGLLLVP